MNLKVQQPVLKVVRESVEFPRSGFDLMEYAHLATYLFLSFTFLLLIRGSGMQGVLCHVLCITGSVGMVQKFRSQQV